ncbi:MAG TPA: aminotransferase class IV [Aggregatilineales bacterium]|nr:aminotransferase class IV [Aggregatilineales bacterium]HQA67683.1 aminotransferase class IV [Aggregatilineales bacterium]HQE17091.1 aminotransferase class IV [Aggregatilineales bacterium]
MPSDIVVFRTSNHELTRLPVEASSFDEATMKTGHGTYSVFRLYSRRRVLRLDQHLDRMRHSAELLGVPFPHTNEELREHIRRAVDASGLEMPRIRLTVPYADPESTVIMLEPFAPPPAEIYTYGVRVGLAHVSREMPGAKDSRFIQVRSELRKQQPGMYEVLLCDEDGYIPEGTSSNFYAVIDGKLYTAGKGMLEGITRSILLEVAPAILPVEFTPPHVDQLPRVSEAMLTSSTRGVVPIVEIAGERIGAGRPGPVTMRLGAAYDDRVESELEEI